LNSIAAGVIEQEVYVITRICKAVNGLEKDEHFCKI